MSRERKGPFWALPLTILGLAGVAYLSRDILSPNQVHIKLPNPTGNALSLDSHDLTVEAVRAWLSKQAVKNSQTCLTGILANSDLQPTTENLSDWIVKGKITLDNPACYPPTLQEKLLAFLKEYPMIPGGIILIGLVSAIFGILNAKNKSFPKYHTDFIPEKIKPVQKIVAPPQPHPNGHKPELYIESIARAVRAEANAMQRGKGVNLDDA